MSSLFTSSRLRLRLAVRVVIAQALVVAVLASGAAAWAARPRGLVVVPHPASRAALSYFKLGASPGSLVRAGSIELRNPTSAPMRVALTPVDGTTLSTLGSAYAPAGSRVQGAARWTALGARTIALAPRSSATVAVSVRVPRSARPGDYLSGVSIEALDQRAGGTAAKGVSIASVDRYAIGVEVWLPGLRTAAIRFTGAQLVREPSGLAFLLLASNTGNAILQGVYGSVQITSGGRTVLQRAIEPGTFIAGTSIAYPVTALREAPSEGTRYRVSAWLRYPGGIARLNTTVTFGHRQAAVQQRYGARPRSSANGGTPPWQLALLGGVILYALATTVLLLRRRARSERLADTDAAGAPARATEPQRESTPV